MLSASELEGTRLSWHKDRVAAWLAGEHVAPITIDCALTQKCNYRCIYCYAQLQKNPGTISLDTIYRFADDCAEMGVKGVSLISDGESTCSDHFTHAINRLYENGIDVGVGTNGSLLGRFMLYFELAKLTYLRINMSAISKKEYCRIHGCSTLQFERMTTWLRWAVAQKKKRKLKVVIGLQMVFLPEMRGHVIPLVEFGKKVGVDYVLIKHCSDDEKGSLGVDYEAIQGCKATLKKAEEMGAIVRWDKIEAGKERCYRQCYGPALFPQFSGSGLVAPCGFFFAPKYEKYHIGRLEDGFRKIWESDRAKKVLADLASDSFVAGRDCGFLCAQHMVNESLFRIKHEGLVLPDPVGPPPHNVNFI